MTLNPCLLTQMLFFFFLIWTLLIRPVAELYKIINEKQCCETQSFREPVAFSTPYRNMIMQALRFSPTLISYLIQSKSTYASSQSEGLHARRPWHEFMQAVSCQSCVLNRVSCKPCLIKDISCKPNLALCIPQRMRPSQHSSPLKKQLVTSQPMNLSWFLHQYRSWSADSCWQGLEEGKVLTEHGRHPVGCKSQEEILARSGIK